MFKIVIYNHKNLKFARIANNDIKFVTLKTILNNKDSFEPSYSWHIEQKLIALILKELPFKHRVDYNIWYKKSDTRPNILECLYFLVANGYISPNIKGIKLN